MLPETRAATESDSGVIQGDFTYEIATLRPLVMDMLKLPRHREGFPSVMLEEQAAARPGVTTRATGALDSVRWGHGAGGSGRWCRRS